MTRSRRAAGRLTGALALLCILCLWGSPLGAEEFGDIAIDLMPHMMDSPVNAGYQVQNYRVRNTGGKDALILLRLNDPDMGGTVEKRFAAPAGSIQFGTLYMPFRQNYAYRGNARLEVFIDGQPQLGAFPTFHMRTNRTVSVLLSSECGDMMKLYERLKYWHSHLSLSPVEVAQWSASVRDYAGIEVIWKTPGEVFPPDVAKAVREWMLLGGKLIEYVAPDAPWPPGVGTEPPDGKLEIPQGWGRYLVYRPIPAEMKDDLRKFLESSVPQHYVHNNEDLPDLKPFQDLDEMVNRYDHSRVLIKPSGVLEEMMPELPVDKLFVVMAVFVILIGPVNYFLLKKMHRQSLLLVTTPCISLLFCGLVIGFVTFNEGWYSRGVANGVTWLDQRERMAYTHGIVELYAPLSIRRPFEFATDDAIAFQYSEEVSSMHLNISRDQIYAPSLLRPRIPLRYQVSRAERRQEQLRISRVPEGLEVINGLGAPLEKLQVADAQGRIHVAERRIEAGERVILQPTDSAAGGATLPVEDVEKSLELTPNARPNLEKLLGDRIKRVLNLQELFELTGLLQPGMYAALLSEAVFYSTGFVPDQFQASHLVIGTFNLTTAEIQ